MKKYISFAALLMIMSATAQVNIKQVFCRCGKKQTPIFYLQEVVLAPIKGEPRAHTPSPVPHRSGYFESGFPSRDLDKWFFLPRVSYGFPV